MSGRVLLRYRLTRTVGRWHEEYCFEERADGTRDEYGIPVVRMGYLHSPLIEPGKSHKRGPLQWVECGLMPLSAMKPSVRRKLPKVASV